MPLRFAVLATLAFTLFVAGPARADRFDHYTNPVLAKAPGAKGVKEIKQLTKDLITDHDQVLPRTVGAFLVVRTNEGRWAKLLVRSARQRVNADTTIPILYIERFVTYREGEEQTVVASGQRLSLFPGFRLSLDLGQVVPEQLGGDLRFVVEGDRAHTEPVGKAKLYLLTAPLPAATPKKGPKVVIGDTFEPAYFNGTYKLYDDGRRSGTLKLTVDRDGSVSGAYYSDRDGAKYEVTGKVGTPAHAIQFSVKFPRSVQTFQGWMFTGNGKAITGMSRLAQHDSGFYALRVEE
jgi:hypothetical protein